MIRLIIGVVLLIVYSCKSDTTNSSDIINSKEINITVEHIGCFGGATQLIKIKEENGKRTLTNSYTRNTNYVSIPETTIAFDIQKEKILSDLITAGNSISSDSFVCTGQSTYKIETEIFKCTFQDNTCTLDKYLTKLLE